MHQPELVFLSETTAIEFEIPPGLPTLTVTDALFRKISDTSTPQGILAVFAFPELETDMSGPPLHVIADGIQDPGNLGSLIRSAAGLGATSITCMPGTVDPFAPKVVRAAAASHFAIPILIQAGHFEPSSGMQYVLADGSGDTAPDDIDWTLPSTLIVGSEARGASDDFRSLADLSVAIPMTRSVESLNAGMAGSIILYEAARQRRAIQT